MASPVTIPMLTSREIKVLHLEPTDVCQARCPQCARETDSDFQKDRKHSLSVDELAGILPEPLVVNLDKMFMCGNYGDPAACHQTLGIYRWFRKLNPDIVLGMNTNGALQTTFWWHELAQILNQPRDYVVFSIDGLEDTNPIYRVNVNWQRLMANAEAFIAGGGSAHWDMLVYQHNQHQVDACQQLARDMGFRWFRAKISKRAMTGRLQASIYIDAQARVSPCCWLGSRQRDFITDFDHIQDSWQSARPNPVCVQTCGADHRGTSFDNQWQREVQLC